MRRKVVKLGPSTLVVSLPSKWIKDFEVNPGDELELDISGRRLVLEPEKLEFNKELTIQIDDKNKKHLKHILSHVYRLGYSKIIVHGDNLEEIKNITSKLLMGFEITSFNDKEYVLENLTEPKEQKFETVLRRIFFIIKETQIQFRKSIESKNFNFDYNEDLRNQTDRFIFFCRRILSNKSEENDVLKWELLTFLMHIQHSYYYLIKYLQKNSIKKDVNIISLLKESETYFNYFYDAYFTKNIELVNRIFDLKEKYQNEKCINLIEKGNNVVFYSYMREIFRLIQVGTSPVLSLLITL